MKALIFFVAASLLIVPCAYAAGLTPSSIKSDVARLGARKTVAKLNAGTSREWESLLAGVQSGRQDWLDAAKAVEPGTDAGTSEGLRAALAQALSRNPAGVLGLVPRPYALTDICTDPLIEPTDAQVAEFQRRTAVALGKIATGSEAASAAECRKRIVDGQ